MKIKYYTPAIEVEELTKADALCASGGDPSPAVPPSPDNNGVNGTDWHNLEKFLV